MFDLVMTVIFGGLGLVKLVVAVMYVFDAPLVMRWWEQSVSGFEQVPERRAYFRSQVFFWLGLAACQFFLAANWRLGSDWFLAAALLALGGTFYFSWRTGINNGSVKAEMRGFYKGAMMMLGALLLLALLIMGIVAIIQLVNGEFVW